MKLLQNTKKPTPQLTDIQRTRTYSPPAKPIFKTPTYLKLSKPALKTTKHKHIQLIHHLKLNPTKIPPRIKKQDIDEEIKKLITLTR